MNILEKFQLKGKKSFVTGGARGIGKRIAVAFAQAGADVAIADIDLPEAEKTAAELKGYDVETIAVETDVTKPESVKNMIETVDKQLGGLDVAVNNAGICINEKAEEMSYESWLKVIDVNLTGVFMTAQAAGQLMIENENGGSIINIASMSGHIVNHPQPQCSYNASKAGVIQLTKSLAAEWAEYDIRVNSISPGYISTDLTRKATDKIPIWKEDTPMKRLGKAEELQGIALYLASNASSFATGSDFVVDGGFTCW